MLHLDLERAQVLVQPAGENRHPTELGGRSGGHHHRPPPTRGDVGAGEHQVGELGTRPTRRLAPLRRLAHRPGLPRQRRLIYPESGVLSEAGIGRYPIPLLQHEHVPGDQVLGRHPVGDPGSHHRGEARQQAPQSLGRPVRLVLLPGAEGTVDQVDDPDRHPQLRKSGHERHPARHPQQQGHHVPEVGAVADQPRRAGRLRERVRPDAGADGGDLLLLQPSGAGGPGGVDAFGGESGGVETRHRGRGCQGRHSGSLTFARRSGPATGIAALSPSIPPGAGIGACEASAT